MEEHIRLPAGDAAVPGRIRLYGYQRGIADAIGDPLIERVTVIKSARIGYTTLLVGALANYVHNDPSSLLCLLPVKDDARNFVVSQVKPVFAESPVVRAKLDAPKAHAHDRDTMLFRRFTGGSLRVVSAEAQRAACTRRASATSPAPPQAKLSRNSKPIPRGGGIRQFEPYMPSQAIWSDRRG
jgi:phage terminase large subunit GpA-like protein